MVINVHNYLSTVLVISTGRALGGPGLGAPDPRVTKGVSKKEDKAKGKKRQRERERKKEEKKGKKKGGGTKREKTGR